MSRPFGVNSQETRTCRLCGCWEWDPCIDEETGANCHWIEDALCSSCWTRLFHGLGHDEEKAFEETLPALSRAKLAVAASLTAIGLAGIVGVMSLPGLFR